MGGLFEIETCVSTLRLRDAISLHPGRPREGHKKSGADTVPPQDTVSPDYAKCSERNSIQCGPRFLFLKMMAASNKPPNSGSFQAYNLHPQGQLSPPAVR